MQQIVTLAKELKDMPVAALGTVIVLGAFALSAFAIYTVGKMGRGRRGRD
jgi:hypothetical protein